MRRTWGFIFVLLVPTISYADSFGGFVSAGYNSGSFSVKDDPYTVKIDLEDGRGGNLTGGVRFRPGIMLRASLDSTTHEGFTACAAGSGCMDFSDEFKRTESRFGVFYAPQFNRVLGLRAGLGFEKITIEAPTVSSTDAASDGRFFEIALLLNAGKAVTFDIGGASFDLENDDAEDVKGAEVAIGATFHAGPVDIGLMGRAISLETELNGGGTVTEDFSEGRVTIGTSWGYLSRNRPAAR